MSNFKPDDIITPVQASDESKIAYLTISRAIKAGKIPSTKTKNSITLIYKDFEKWWREYQGEQNLIADRINKSREILEGLNKKSDSSYIIHKYGSVIPGCYVSKKYEQPQESEFLPKNIKYICKSFKLKANCYASVELTSLIKGFRPQKLIIKVTNSMNIETFCEICNITVMGDPQLTNFNGVTDDSMRGNSILFENGLDVSNWSIFGASPGQGLVIDFGNPHVFDIKVEILLSGWETKSDYLGMFVNTNKNKILFAKVKCNANEITKVNILAGRRSAFKANYLQINHFNTRQNIYGITDINNISVLNKQQFDYLDENNISTTHFEKMKQVSFDAFSEIKGKGLDISFDNKSEFEVVNYITLLGEPVDTDLIGQK